ncbi:hypothetical protein [Paracoccus saliphilus]|uniref:Uncharacterized protein n=1 Tax=Paracoccus saliphilus TaxID=405559 RepID=A0AA45W756_9RHOB|nr:hypothetical protein [Paracoccus saliphilus]SIT06804.1 hypothetical protein SAMN05421772_11580 [Paracoccus saliphilus]
MTLELIDLSVSPSRARPLFPPLSLRIRAGEVATLMGPPGSANPPCSMPSAGIWDTVSRSRRRG